MATSWLQKFHLIISTSLKVAMSAQVHGDYTEEAGAPVERPAEEIPGNEPAEAEAEAPAT